MFSGKLKTVHFIGVGGTAMASVAAAMAEKGFVVTGSDLNVYPPMSTFLAERKIRVMNGYSEANLDFRPDLVVIGNAISRGNPEAESVLEHKLRYCSLPELLKEFFIRGRRSIVVAGTHGKTTTTSLLAWVFEHNGLKPSYLIGGVPENLGQGARFADGECFILEGDEYDTAFFDKRSKFLHYLPEAVIINNLEFDHADIFQDLEAVKKTFSHLVRIIPRNGLLLANGEDPNLPDLLAAAPCPVKRFGLSEASGVRALNLHLGATASGFEVEGYRFQLNLVGEFNVRNALAVVACARHFGLPNPQIQSAFDTFRGIKRRMEVRGVVGGVTLIDDFGHHPTAIRETLAGLRVKYPSQKIWAVFEPRSNSTRRNVFQHDLVAAFSRADVVVVAQVARLEQLAPAERLDPEKLMRDLKNSGRETNYLPDADAIVAHLVERTRAEDVIVVFSNGGFGGIHEKLLDQLARR